MRRQPQRARCGARHAFCGTDFQGGHITLTTGQAETGWVPFIAPDGVRITAVSWTPGWGSGGTSATWAVQGS